MFILQISNMFYITKISSNTFAFTKLYNNAEQSAKNSEDFMIIKKLGHFHILEFYSGNIATAKVP